jgi:hypothetical protein
MVSVGNVKLGQVGNDIHEKLAKWCYDAMCFYLEGDEGILIILDNGVNQLPRLVI